MLVCWEGRLVAMDEAGCDVTEHRNRLSQDECMYRSGQVKSAPFSSQHENPKTSKLSEL